MIESEEQMRDFGRRVGQLLSGGETIELVGDVGAGKTTFVKGLGVGLGIDEDIQSPSFTISRVYEGRDSLVLAHYDFYRLGEAGILSEDVQESMGDARTVTVIEWADIIEGVLPKGRLTLTFTSTSETTRELVVSAPDSLLRELSA